MMCRRKDEYSYNFGYGRMYYLRYTIAKEIFKDKFDIYERWLKTNEKTPADELNNICEEFREVAGLATYEFLTQPDCEGKLTLKQVKEIYDKIKDSKADLSMCYSGDYTEERYTDFLDLCKVCIENHRGIEWF